MNRVEIFERELNLIQDKSIRRFAEQVLERVSAYFFLVPASSTKKYHSRQSNIVGGADATGGLVNHTKSVVYFCNILCRAYQIEGRDRDLAIVACLFHDSRKYSEPMQRWTSKTHDKESADFVYKVYTQENPEGISKEDITEICKAIAFHMGSFTTEERRKKFPEEYSTIEMLTHVADMVSAGREVNLEFLDMQENLIG